MPQSLIRVALKSLVLLSTVAIIAPVVTAQNFPCGDGLSPFEATCCRDSNPSAVGFCPGIGGCNDDGTGCCPPDAPFSCGGVCHTNSQQCCNSATGLVCASFCLETGTGSSSSNTGCKDGQGNSEAPINAVMASPQQAPLPKPADPGPPTPPPTPDNNNGNNGGGGSSSNPGSTPDNKKGKDSNNGGAGTGGGSNTSPQASPSPTLPASVTVSSASSSSMAPAKSSSQPQHNPDQVFPPATPPRSPFGRDDFGSYGDSSNEPSGTDPLVFAGIAGGIGILVVLVSSCLDVKNAKAIDYSKNLPSSLLSR